VLSTAVCLAAATGCNRGDRPTVTESRSAGAPEDPQASVLGAKGSSSGATSAAVGSSQAPNAPPVPAQVTDEGYTVALKPTGTYRAGQAGAVQVVLEAQAPYKVNDEYPFKFQTQPTEGIEFDQAVVRKDGMQLEKQRGTMTVKLKPVAQGKLTVSGKFYFSICTGEKCRFGKQDLATQIEVR
jgi:hypothetical protein